MERKGMPFPDLQCMAQGVLTPQIITVLGKWTRPPTEGPNLNVPFPHL